MSWIKAIILVGLFAGLATAQQPRQPRINRSDGIVLQPGTPIKRTITPDASHNFSVTVDENNLVQLTVEQDGIDIVVYVYSPSGKKVVEHDSPNGAAGPENVSFVTVEKGPYRVMVSPLRGQEDGAEGSYEIKIIEVRPASEQEIKTGKNEDELKASALALLGEIEGIISELKVPQTRIRAQLQAAQMLWAPDEKRALKYATDAINGVKELHANLDPENRDYIKHYHSISSLRYEIIQSLIERQPELALTFIRSVPPLPNPHGHDRRQAGVHEAALEIQIANQFASKDPKRTLEIAREILKSRYSTNLISTVNTLRQQNPEMAAELAGDIANKVLSEKDKSSPELSGLLIQLLHFGGSSRPTRPAGTNGAPQRPALLSEQQYRDLLQKAVSEALAFKQPPSNIYTPERDYAWNLLNGLQSMGAAVDSVMNGGAAAIEKKVAEFHVRQNPYVSEMNKFQTALNDPNTPLDDTLESLARAPKEVQNQLYMHAATRAATNGDIAKAKQIIRDHISNPFERQQALAGLEQQAMYSAMSKGKAEDALRNIANLQSVQERAQLLSQIASQIGPGYKRAAALNLLEQARALLPPTVQAQDQVQMNALCELARAFARYDAKRAFEIVDPLVDQFNELSAAARVMEGFGAEYFHQDELDLHNGNAVGNFATQVTTTLATLGLSNFERAKLAADRLRLPEVRLRAYLDLAARALNPQR
jgi:hypothetical protein